MSGFGSAGGQPARFTRLSKSLSALLVLLSLVAWLVPSTRAYLTLVPARTLPFAWTLITAGFVTISPVQLAVDVLSLLLLARIVEPIYGSTEFLKLVLVVDLSACLCTFVTVFLVYLVSPNKDAGTLYIQFSGFHGVVAGLLVAVKQIMPDHEIKVAGVLRLRARFFPSVFLLVAAPLAFVLKAWSSLPFLLFGTYSAWLYLRFFQQQPETSIKGDPSEDFKFSSFFPDFVQPPIDLIAGACSTVFRLKHGPGSAEARPLLSVAPGVLGADTADANRRRERGQKALEERLGMKRQADVEAGMSNGAAGAVESAAAEAKALPPSSSATL